MSVPEQLFCNARFLAFEVAGDVSEHGVQRTDARRPMVGNGDVVLMAALGGDKTNVAARPPGGLVAISSEKRSQIAA